MMKKLPIGGLHEALSGLNIAFATGYALAAYGFTFFETKYAPAPSNALKYFFLRGAVRVNSVLHFSSDARIGQELTFIISIFSLTLVALVLFRFFVGARARHVLLSSVAGIAVIFAVPASLFYAASLTWKSRAVFPIEDGALWASPAKTVFVGDVILVCLVLWFVRSQPLRMPLYGTLLTLHYALWSCIFWFAPSQIRLLSPAFFVPALAFSGVAWLLYVRRSRENPSEANASGTPVALEIASAFVAIALLLSLWLPVRGYTISRTRDLQSLAITMVRRGCFGRCPVYKLAIHGTGWVEYSGTRNVGVAGAQTATIPREQITRLLQELDHVNFFALDDRAFERCADTEVVSVSVSVDGRGKSLNTDTFCVGARSGPQARLVGLAQEIDRIVGSEKWVRCVGPCLD